MTFRETINLAALKAGFGSKDKTPKVSDSELDKEMELKPGCTPEQVVDGLAKVFTKHKNFRSN